MGKKKKRGSGNYAKQAQVVEILQAKPEANAADVRALLPPGVELLSSTLSQCRRKLGISAPAPGKGRGPTPEVRAGEPAPSRRGGGQRKTANGQMKKAAMFKTLSAWMESGTDLRTVKELAELAESLQKKLKD